MHLAAWRQVRSTLSPDTDRFRNFATAPQTIFVQTGSHKTEGIYRETEPWDGFPSYTHEKAPQPMPP